LLCVMWSTGHLPPRDRPHHRVRAPAPQVQQEVRDAGCRPLRACAAG